MTNQEAVKQIKRISEHFSKTISPELYDKVGEALDMAIEALEVKVGLDIIGIEEDEVVSRRKVLEEINKIKWSNNWPAAATLAVLNTPSASKDDDWILCSKKMPKEREWIGTKAFGTTISKEVYVTFERADGGRFTRHLSFQNGKLAPPDDNEDAPTVIEAESEE